MTTLPRPAGTGVADQVLDGLVLVVGEQEVLCERLLEISMAERGMVAGAQIEDLERTSREKAGLIEQIEKLDARRVRIVRAITSELGISGAVSLRELAVALPGPQRTSLEEARDRVVRVVSALRDVNDVNLEAMKHSLDLVRESLRNLRRLAGTGEIYDSGGRQRWDAAGMLALDRRA